MRISQLHADATGWDIEFMKALCPKIYFWNTLFNGSSNNLLGFIREVVWGTNKVRPIYSSFGQTFILIYLQLVLFISTQNWSKLETCQIWLCYVMCLNWLNRAFFANNAMLTYVTYLSTLCFILRTIICCVRTHHFANICNYYSICQRVLSTNVVDDYNFR